MSDQISINADALYSDKECTILFMNRTDPDIIGELVGERDGRRIIRLETGGHEFYAIER